MIADHHKLIEAQRLVVQSLIDAGKSPAERNRAGQFATPNALAINIARFVATLTGYREGGIRFADPSVGSGSFFSAALTAFGPDQIKSAIGVELDPTFADAAQKLWTSFGLEVVQGDFTRLVCNGSCPAAPNLILANPPYVRHHHMDREEKSRLKRLANIMAGVEVNGLAGLYVYFLILATAWMEEGGYAAWLVPSEFMDVNYGASLKRFLSDRVTLIRAHRFDPTDVQFGDALVSSVVLVFKKSSPQPHHETEFTFGGTLTEPQASQRISREKLRASRKWSVYPTHSKNDRHTTGNGTGPRLSDFFRVQRGIATGDNKFFILDRADAERRGLPAQYLRPILPSPRYLKTIIIDSDPYGYPLINPQLCVIDCDLPEDVVEKKYPAFWAYLQTAQELGVKNSYLVGKRTPWYKQEQRQPCPFLCTYMGRGANGKQPFRFIHNLSKAIGTNLYLMLYPRNKLMTMLEKHPERARDVHALLCQVTGHELRGEGRVYGGGLNKIEPSELGRISASSFTNRWNELETATKETQFSLF